MIVYVNLEAYVDKQLTKVSFHVDHVVAVVELDDDLEDFVEVILSTGDKFLIKGNHREITKSLDARA